MPALLDGKPVMLKLTPEPDEIRGGRLLEWWGGRGAVRVLARDAGALLMERPTGTRSLVRMALDGQDEAATDILCAVASELHRPGSQPLPPLEPLQVLFEELLLSDSDDPLVRAGKAIAGELLADQYDLVPLHGDLQHSNVLDAGGDRWVAIDPKGQFGERAYDFVNLFRNPIGTIGNDPTVFARRLRQVASHAELDPRRLSAWIVAFCALCLVWDYYPQGNSAADRQLAQLAIVNLGEDA